MSSLPAFPAIYFASMLLGACATLPQPTLPDSTPPAWSTPLAADAPVVALRQWWRHFSDPRLDALIDEALRQNLDLAQARHRWSAAQRLRVAASAPWRPTLAVQAAPAQTPGTRASWLQAGVGAQWLLDLFDASAVAQAEAKAHALDTLAGWQATQVLVVAEVASQYLRMTHAAQQARLARAGLDLDVRLLQLAQQRHALGLDDERQLAARRAAQREAELALAEACAERDDAALRLALWLGRTQPDPLWRGWRQAWRLGEFVLAELPADLLRSRPDIHLAEAGVLSAAASLGLARQALYPRLRLGGVLQYEHPLGRVAGARGRAALSFGPFIDVPLWDWGWRRARVEAGEHELAAALLAYRQAVAVGISEVEQALLHLAAQRRQLAVRAEALAAQREADAKGQRRQQLGLLSEYARLDLARAALTAHQSLRQAEAEQALAFVALYQALGGAPLPAGQ